MSFPPGCDTALKLNGPLDLFSKLMPLPARISLQHAIDGIKVPRIEFLRPNRAALVVDFIYLPSHT